jgi:hypothetical protein
MARDGYPMRHCGSSAKDARGGKRWQVWGGAMSFSRKEADRAQRRDVSRE